ncbi:ATP-binding protein [Planotetraspora sp. GP83]|uniref:ATP-binding protein n=1 Tax=Planotetraspora sp. GP83 TaxID=3156264 RepID=UPI003511BEC5
MSWVLPRDVASVSTARRRVRSQLAAWGYGGQHEVAELLVSELVTNALCHGWGEPVLTLVLRGGTPRCEVRDDNPEPISDTGRGLLLVDRLSRSWGSRPSDAGRPGKVVWFELPAQPYPLKDPPKNLLKDRSSMPCGEFASPSRGNQRLRSTWTCGPRQDGDFRFDQTAC